MWNIKSLGYRGEYSQGTDRKKVTASTGLISLILAAIPSRGEKRDTWLSWGRYDAAFRGSTVLNTPDPSPRHGGAIADYPILETKMKVCRRTHPFPFLNL